MGHWSKARARKPSEVRGLIRMETHAALPSEDGHLHRDTLSERNADIVQGFTWAERLLHRFSKDPAGAFVDSAYRKPTAQWTPSTALRDLIDAFPGFKALIRGRRVLDYGCGDGFQAVAMAEAGAVQVLGVDTEPRRLQHARRLARGLTNVAFATEVKGTFNVAISLNSFEHFKDPETSLDELARATGPGGIILITFGSPWLSPYGSHMNFFTHVPWVNVLFSERTVFEVRRLYRNDSSRSYVPAVNKMTIARFERIIAKSGLRVVSLKYKAVRNLPILAHIPCVREFFINRVTCVLTT
jgi:SAM-dependent methyltransferase